MTPAAAVLWASVLVLGLAGCAKENDVADRPRTEAGTAMQTGAKCGDGTPANHADLIEDFAVVHSATTIEMEARLAGIDPERDQHITFALVTPEAAWTIQLARFHGRNGGVRPFRFFARAPKRPRPDETHGCVFMTSQVGDVCRLRGRIDAAAGIARVVLPRTCLDNPGSIRGGVRVGYLGPKRSREMASDEWDEQTSEDERWLVPPLVEPIDAPTGAPIGCQDRAPKTVDKPGPGAVSWMGRPPCVR